MSAYNQERNVDNSVLRYIIVATLAELKDKVFFYNRIEERLLRKIHVPFFSSVTGSERFLVDNFIDDAENSGKALGNYEVVPRGVLQLSSISIDAGSQTNKFVRGEFVREANGVLRTFSLDTNFLPLDVNFSITVVCSNNLEMLKVTESIINKLYKSTLFSVDLGLFRIEAAMQIPEDFNKDRLFEFTINDKKEFNVTFDLNLKTFMPIFESGILLSELDEMISKSNTDAPGIGLFRSNALGELGIWFGGVFEKFEYSVDDITSSNLNEGIRSNININKTDPARLLLIDDIESANESEESDESKKFRNSK